MATSDYTVEVQTRDKKNAGTDANVFIILHGENGLKTENLKLNQVFKNNLERGMTDIFSFSSKSYVGDIEYIEVWRDDFGLGASWFVDTISVSCSKSGSMFVFPLLRWIKSDRHYTIRCYDTSLPQDDPYKNQRATDQQERRYMYQIYTASAGLPAQVRDMPEDEAFSFDYKFDILQRKIGMNIYRAWQLISKGNTWESLEDFNEVYTQPYGVPYGIERWKDDFYFGWQKLNSLNPSLICLCSHIPEKFGVTDELLLPLLDGLTLQQAIDHNRLFIIDLEIMQDIPTRRKDLVIPAPIALFFLNNKKQLLPVAIQLYQQKSEQNPVFLPTDPPLTWTMAKMWYNLADATYHQSLAHIGFTHLIMESVCVTMHRNFSLSHPLYKLLAPHFFYLLAINTRARGSLLNPDGFLNILMSSGVGGIFHLSKKGMKVWRIDVHGTLPEDLKRRGVQDPNILPNYHFRDDAMLLYNVIKKYVTDYVDLYYDDIEKIESDWELQGFGDELTKRWEQGGCGLMGIPNNGKFTSVDHIVLLLTSVIYTCSVSHAAVNFPMYDEYGFPPNYPLLLNGTPPVNKEPLSEVDVLTSMPDKEMVLDLMKVTKLLSEKGTNSLGDFEVQYIYDPPAVEIAKRFREDLKNISEIVKERNKSRSPKYTWLDPVNIPNSISI